MGTLDTGSSVVVPVGAESKLQYEALVQYVSRHYDHLKLVRRTMRGVMHFWVERRETNNENGPAVTR